MKAEWDVKPKGGKAKNGKTKTKEGKKDFVLVADGKPNDCGKGSCQNKTCKATVRPDKGNGKSKEHDKNKESTKKQE